MFKFISICEKKTNLVKKAVWEEIPFWSDNCDLNLAVSGLCSLALSVCQGWMLTHHSLSCKYGQLLRQIYTIHVTFIIV